MATHQITIEISDETLLALDGVLASGVYRSQGEVLEAAFCEMQTQAKENGHGPWTPEEADAIIAEADADPDGWLTIEQVEEHFARKDKTLVEAA